MRRYVVLNKTIGKTPLQTLTEWKKEHTQYATVPATYAGRLDPMASGKLLVLLGDECKRKNAYTNFDKEYEVSVLLDISTDTGDVLGIPLYSGKDTVPTAESLGSVLCNEIGTSTHQYPAYSSKTVGGIPLFMHALRGSLADIAVPTHMESIFSIELVSTQRVSLETLREYVEQTLKVVPTDDAPSKEAGRNFRQDDIRTAWEALFISLPHREFTIIKIKVACGTGTYMRTLAERIGHALGTSSCALSIHRTIIGRYRNLGPLSFFYPFF